MKRRLKTVNVAVNNNSVKELENTPNLKNIIFTELYEAIKDTADNPTKKTATLFEINDSGTILDIAESDWVTALEEAIVFFEQKEEYEKCNLYKTLINQLYERRSKQNNTSSKQNVKGKNSSKKKVKKPNRSK